MENRHHLTSDTKSTSSRSSGQAHAGRVEEPGDLGRVVFHQKRHIVHPLQAQFRRFMFEQSKPKHPEMIELVTQLKVRHGLKMSRCGFPRRGEKEEQSAPLLLGEPEELHPHLRQLIQSMRGAPPQVEGIHSEEFLESLREFSALGAFVVNMKGVVESAGTYIDAPAKKVKVSPGLGARHTAAASITAHTNSVAVVISESSGCVVFHDGRAILELEKPKPTPRRRSSTNG